MMLYNKEVLNEIGAIYKQLLANNVDLAIL